MSIRTFQDHTPKIAPTAYIDPFALVIGEVVVEDFASLWPMVVARGDVNKIIIGTRTNIQDGSILHVSHQSSSSQGRSLMIGERVTVGHQSTLHACTIEHHCLIGIGSIVLDGSVIQPYTFLAAGSLVPPGKVLEGGYLWRGRPTEKVRSLTPEEIEYLTYSADHYVQLAQQHHSLLCP